MRALSSLSCLRLTCANTEQFARLHMRGIAMLTPLAEHAASASDCNAAMVHAAQQHHARLATPVRWPAPLCRGAIRERAQLLITNPDMLHMSVLPVHGHFR